MAFIDVLGKYIVNTDNIRFINKENNNTIKIYYNNTYNEEYPPIDYLYFCCESEQDAAYKTLANHLIGSTYTPEPKETDSGVLPYAESASDIPQERLDIEDIPFDI